MLHFTIRDVLWLTVVVGMAAGWWLDRVPKTVEVFPHELVKLCDDGQVVRVTMHRDGYDAVSPLDRGQSQHVRRTITFLP